MRINEFKRHVKNNSVAITFARYSLPSEILEPRRRQFVKKRGNGKSASLRSKPRLQYRPQPTPSARPPMRQRAKQPNRQNETRLEAEQKATRDARYAARKAAKKKRRRGY